MFINICKSKYIYVLFLRTLLPLYVTYIIGLKLFPSKNDAGFHEYIDYIFPDADKQHTSNIKLLAMAHQWKRQKPTVDSDC